MRTPTASRVLAAAIAMLDRHRKGETVHPVPLQWARETVFSNVQASGLDYEVRTVHLRPAGTWERSTVPALLRPAQPFDGLIA